MKANYISLDLSEKLERGEIVEGYISNVFSSLFTVLTDDDELIYFLNNKRYIAPMSIVLEDLGSFRDFNLSSKTKVSFRNTHIMIDSHRIDIETQRAKSWNPEMKLLEEDTDENIIDRNLLEIEECVYKHGKYEGFAPLIFNIGEYIEELKSLSNLKIHNNLYSSFISGKVIEFVFSITNNKFDEMAEAVSEFIGFGPGITPSSDDFLCGFMTSLLYFGQHYKLDLKKILEFNTKVLSQVELDKTKISHNLLVHYSKGNSQKMIKNLMNSIIYEEDKEETCKSIRETISFGDISGTDMVCGVYLAARLIKTKNFKKNFI